MANPWINNRLKALRRGKGELARALGVDPARVSEIIAGRRNVQVAELPKMAAFLDMPANELLSQLTREVGGAQASLAATLAPIPEGLQLGRVELPAAPPRRTLPVYGSAMGGSDGAFEMNGQTVEYVECPPSLEGANSAYGLYVQGDSMHPRFEPGWLVHVNPTRPVRRGDSVVVQIRPPDPDTPPLAYLKVFDARTPSELVVIQYNPPGEMRWPLDEVVSVHRVVGIAEM